MCGGNITLTSSEMLDTHTQERQSDHQESYHRCQPPSHSMTKRTKNICSNQIWNGGRQESSSLLPVTRVHCVHHPQREGGFENRDSWIGESVNSMKKKICYWKHVKNQKIKPFQQSHNLITGIGKGECTCCNKDVRIPDQGQKGSSFLIFFRHFRLKNQQLKY